MPGVPMRGVELAVPVNAGERPLAPGLGELARDPAGEPPSSFFQARGVAGRPAPRIDMAREGKAETDGRRATVPTRSS